MRMGILYFVVIVFVVTALGCGKDESPPTAPEEDKVNVAPEVVAWLKGNAIPFTTPIAGHGFDDLEPLREMIGNARVVALGEATHGTRQFFLMKHRLLEFLVKEMGFTSFAIEATWPESNLVNDYIQTGEGNPAALLAGLYFWTWNTQEVLDMILWMRENGVSFHGFDMQYPTMAMENVEAYVAEVDPANAAVYELLFDNFRPWLDELGSYQNVPPATQNTIRDQLQRVYDMMVERQATYETRSSEKEFAYALQSARIVQQGERYYAAREPSHITRDTYMAENASWILEQEGPGAKIVLWAHNYHVGIDPISPRTMGTHLREQYQDDMVVIAFSFFKGSFNARTYDYWQGVGELKSHSVKLPPEDSYSYHFRGADMPRMILDLRGGDFDSTATDWIPGPRRFRSIGALYDDSNPGAYFYNARLPEEFDVIVYFENTTPSVLLPFRAGTAKQVAADVNEKLDYEETFGEFR